jgi:hypothetical protein
MRTKADLLGELKLMLNDMLAARARGVAPYRLARAHGYVDGYMRALIETGAATQKELLAVVAAERKEVFGPALLERSPLSDADIAA